uniref:ATP synthase F0 subunit 8 n=1 Tax=Labidura japonica TaxID=761919 RepID=A0A1J0M4H8_9NEOP|nr:ATP synthase F0 subunit 8 [Labidura japonica]
MPQMAPMNWMSMYWGFIIILLLIGALNYYLSMSNMNSLSNMKSGVNMTNFMSKNMNWKW